MMILLEEVFIVMFCVIVLIAMWVLGAALVHFGVVIRDRPGTSFLQTMKSILKDEDL